jgi:Transposase DDE domain
MLVTLFYHIDEFCKRFEETMRKKTLTGKENARNRSCNLSLSEIMTICAYYHYSGYKTFKDYYCKYVLEHMQKDFKSLVSYNRFIELKARTIVPLALFSKAFCTSSCSGISFIDSFSLKVCNNRRIHSHKVFRGIAQRGKTSVDWFYGFKLHFVINHQGEILNFYISAGNASDNNDRILQALTKDLFGKLIGDKGYIVRPEIFEKLYYSGIQLITKLRQNMKNKLMPFADKLLLRKRGIIESVIGIMKQHLSIGHTRHRSPLNFLSHIFSTITAYFFKQYKPSITSFSVPLL